MARERSPSWWPHSSSASSRRRSSGGWPTAAAGAAQTLGSVFIVEGHPPSEWDARIGWFRFTFGLGQVAGLTIGAVFAEGRVDLGWFVAGAVILLGTFLGRLGLPHLPPATP